MRFLVMLAEWALTVAVVAQLLCLLALALLFVLSDSLRYLDGKRLDKDDLGVAQARLDRLDAGVRKQLVLGPDDALTALVAGAAQHRRRADGLWRAVTASLLVGFVASVVGGVSYVALANVDTSSFLSYNVAGTAVLVYALMSGAVLVWTTDRVQRGLRRRHADLYTTDACLGVLEALQGLPLFQPDYPRMLQAGWTRWRGRQDAPVPDEPREPPPPPGDPRWPWRRVELVRVEATAKRRDLAWAVKRLSTMLDEYVLHFLGGAVDQRHRQELAAVAGELARGVRRYQTLVLLGEWGGDAHDELRQGAIRHARAMVTGALLLPSEPSTTPVREQELEVSRRRLALSGLALLAYTGVLVALINVLGEAASPLGLIATSAGVLTVPLLFLAVNGSKGVRLWAVVQGMSRGEDGT